MRKRPIVPRSLHSQTRRRIRDDQEQETAAEKKAATFERKHNSLKNFMDQYRDIFDEYKMLVEERNSSLVEAIAAAKSELRIASDKKSLSFGSIHVAKSTSKKWDGAMLYNIIDPDIRDECITRETVYNVDTKTLETMIKQEDVAMRDIQRALTVSHTVKVKPTCAKEIILP